MSESKGTTTFRFALGERVKISESGEEGTVIGYAAYQTADPGFLLRYKDGHGVATEQWWTSSALEAA